MSSRPPPRRRPTRDAIDDAAKRAFDIAIAALLLTLLLPLFLVIAAAIKLESSGPVLYRCRRVGLEGAEFAMFKFRKMREEAAGPPLTVSGDERLTRLGRYLAASKLDELPQLWNVLRGQMSLVGPRPEDPVLASAAGEAYLPVLQVKPGVTGLTQLAFVRESRMLDPVDAVGDYVTRLLPQKIALDRLYAARHTLLLDLRILVWTAIALAPGTDVVVDRVTGRASVRRRPSIEPAEQRGRP